MADTTPKPPEEQVVDEPKKSKPNQVESTKPTIASPTVKKPAITSETGWRKWWALYRRKKKLSVPLTILAVLLILLAIPATRYPLLGIFMKSSPEVHVLDSKTNDPVSGAQVTLANQHGKTDGKGVVHLGKVKVGHQTLTIEKKYYQTANTKVLVSPGKSTVSFTTMLVATGRQVTVHVANKITNKPVPNVTVKASGTEAQTDSRGTAAIVLPPNQSEVDATLSAKGFNGSNVKIKVSEANDPANNFTLTPSGKLYFLSKQTGKIDVVKTNLDGTNRQTVLLGTGNEDDQDTVLLAARDWKFLALKSRRGGTTAKDTKLYLIDTSNDQLTTMDEGDASFTPVGWANHRFIYQVTRNSVHDWQPKKYAIKAYNADTKQLSTLDETTVADGSSQFNFAEEVFSTVYIINNATLVYAKGWTGSYPHNSAMWTGRQHTFVSINTDGSGKKTLLGIDANVYNSYFNTQLYAADEVIFGVYNQQDNKDHFFEYDNGTVKEATDITDDTFSKFYPTYLQSPSGKLTFWYEPRDGKNTLFIGDADGKNGNEIGSLTEYVPYGWYGEDYLLVSKKDSELYIFGNGPITDQATLKVTDYHKPAQTFRGYGGGYGGF